MILFSLTFCFYIVFSFIILTQFIFQFSIDNYNKTKNIQKVNKSVEKECFGY